MKKTMLVLAMGMFFVASSYSNALMTQLEPNFSVENNANAIQDSVEFKNFERLYTDFLDGIISMDDFLYAGTSLEIAKAFLEKVGLPNYGGYTETQDIIGFALVQYLVVISST
ncbi:MULTISPECIES: hypothetical protein [Myroides]|uniref:hypothetical protein n=1 Tax=Myroides odoratus TaxID=256 RepID=UPI0024BF4F10|nr:hypothetical protein [Myroides sp. mNGS23_01]WHT40533.1 hypothetical protein QNH98_08270 [Myroides sp. mNGS23_01]